MSNIPRNIDCEKVVIGCLLRDGRLLSACADLADDDFYLERHMAIFAAIHAVGDRGVVDVVLVAEELLRRKMLEVIGGPAYLAELVEDIGTTAGFDHHVGVLREKGTLRRIIAAATSIVSNASGVDVTADEATEHAVSLILQATRLKGQTGPQALSHFVGVALGNIEARCSGRQRLPSTGFHAVDEHVGGLVEGDVIIVAGATAMGKTAFMCDVVERVARQGHLSLLFQLEMSGEQIALRRLAQRSRVGLKALRTEAIGIDSARRVINAAAELSPLPIVIDDRGAVSLGYVASWARRLTASHGHITLIALDYVQLMGVDDRRDSRRDEKIAACTRGLKALAKELQTTIIVGAQVNRDLAKRTDKRPILSDLRESGAIEQDADSVWFVYRDEYYRPNDTPDPGIAEIIIAKQRNGPTATARLAFDGTVTRFSDIDEPVGGWI